MAKKRKACLSNNVQDYSPNLGALFKTLIVKREKRKENQNGKEKKSLFIQ